MDVAHSVATGCAGSATVSVLQVTATFPQQPGWCEHACISLMTGLKILRSLDAGWSRAFCWSALAFGAVYLATAIVALGGGGIPAEGLISAAVLGIFLVALSVIDARSYRLPDVLTLPLIALGLLFTAFLHWDDLWLRVAAAALGYTSLYLVASVYIQARGRAGLGLGDAKLFAASGAWLGLDGLPSVLLIASLTALLFAGGAHLSGHKVEAGTRVAFGPFLAFGTWIVWLYGPLIFAL